MAVQEEVHFPEGGNQVLSFQGLEDLDLADMADMADEAEGQTLDMDQGVAGQGGGEGGVPIEGENVRHSMKTTTNIQTTL